MSMAVPTTVFTATVPKPRLRLLVPLPAVVVYSILLLMAVLPIGVGAAILVQTPTMSVHKPAPGRATPRPAPVYVAQKGVDEELRRDYDTTVPALVATVERMQVQADRDAVLFDDMRLKLELTQAAVARQDSYFAYMAATLTAVCMGMMFQIYQRFTEKQRQQEQQAKA